MKKLIAAGSAVLAVVLLSGFAAHAGHRGGWGHPSPERMKQFLTWRVDSKLDDVKATDAQRQSIHAIEDRLFTDAQPLMADQKAAREEAFTQLTSDTPDARKLHALVDARIEAMRAFAHKATDAALEAHKVLTPEQRKALADDFREHMEAR